MTGTELLKTALGLFFEEEPGDYETLALSYLNILLAEAFDTNNRMRRFGGKEELAEIPLLATLGDMIPYEEKLCRLALPYGLASKLYFDEDDNARLSMFNEEYANRLRDCDRWVVSF